MNDFHFLLLYDAVSKKPLEDLVYEVCGRKVREFAGRPAAVKRDVAGRARHELAHVAAREERADAATTILRVPGDVVALVVGHAQELHALLRGRDIVLCSAYLGRKRS